MTSPMAIRRFGVELTILSLSFFHNSTALSNSHSCSAAFRSAKPYKTLRMGEAFRGEQSEGVAGRLKARYLNKQQLHLAQIKVKGGELFDSNGGKLSLHGDPARHFIYVMDPVGNIYLGPMSEGPRSFYHSSFLQGKPVAAAGEARISDGNLYLNIGSGHYEPKEEHLIQVAQQLVGDGFDPNRIFLSPTFEEFSEAESFGVFELKRSRAFKNLTNKNRRLAMASVKDLVRTHLPALRDLFYSTKFTKKKQLERLLLAAYLEMLPELSSAEAWYFMKDLSVVYEDPILKQKLYVVAATMGSAHLRNVILKDLLFARFRPDDRRILNPILQAIFEHSTHQDLIIRDVLGLLSRNSSEDFYDSRRNMFGVITFLTTLNPENASPFLIEIVAGLPTKIVSDLNVIAERKLKDPYASSLATEALRNLGAPNGP